VLTHRAKTPEDDDAVVFLSGDVGDAVMAGLAAAGDRNLEVLGTDVTVQCLARGLVDEVYVHVLPVLLGAGVPLFRTPAMTPIRLEPMISSSNGSVTSMRFRIRKEP
jgi:dihydrofolate reductase